MATQLLSRTVLVALFAIVLAACSGGEDAASVPTSGPAGEGYEIALRQCLSCHSVEGGARVGPTWAGLWGSERRMDDGEVRTVDLEYLTEAIRDPDAARAEGVRSRMPAFDLSDEEIENLAAYMETLSE